MDPDDWFADGLPRPGSPQSHGADEPLEAAGARSELGGRTALRPATRTRVLAAAAGVAALLVIGLAAGGVFSGGRAPKHKPPATTAATTAATTQVSTQQSTTTPLPVVPSTPLKPGDKGAAVKLLQRALARLGYSVGAVDGGYGPKTQAAVLKFQRAEGLTADGIAGSTTLRLLRRKLAASG